MPHDERDYWTSALEERHQLFRQMASGRTGEQLESLVDVITRSVVNGGRVLLFGNGGSAAQAQHVAAEFVGRFLVDRRPLPALALTCDTSTLTAVGNDYGFDAVFERQVEALAGPGDVVIGISTSGASRNVARGLRVASRKKATAVAVLGKQKGIVGRASRLVIQIPSTFVPLIQEAHSCLFHILCDELDHRLSSANYNLSGASGRAFRSRSIR